MLCSSMFLYHIWFSSGMGMKGWELSIYITSCLCVLLVPSYLVIRFIYLLIKLYSKQKFLIYIFFGFLFILTVDILEVCPVLSHLMFVLWLYVLFKKLNDTLKCAHKLACYSIPILSALIIATYSLSFLFSKQVIDVIYLVNILLYSYILREVYTMNVLIKNKLKERDILIQE